MTAEVIDIDSARPHTSGPCICLNCKHSWTGVVPARLDSFICPKCSLPKGVRTGLVTPDYAIACPTCDNSHLWVLGENDFLCPVCADQFGAE